MRKIPDFIHIKHNKIRWRPDLIADYQLFKQIEGECVLTGDKWKDYDALLSKAGEYGIGLEVDYDEK